MTCTRLALTALLPPTFGLAGCGGGDDAAPPPAGSAIMIAASPTAAAIPIAPFIEGTTP